MRFAFVLGFLSLVGCGFGGSDPAAVAKMYEPCDFVAECVHEAELCKRIDIDYGTPGASFLGAVCTVECTASALCPKDGVCVSIPGDDVLVTCQKRCASADDCAPNYVCRKRTTLDEGEVRMCLPACASNGMDRC